MSKASHALPPISSTSPASHPVLLNGDRIDRVKLRAELRYMVDINGWNHGHALIRLMQKARLQLKWARKDIADRAAVRSRSDAFEAEAQSLADRTRLSTLTYLMTRYEFGSMAENHEAPRMRKLYRRAVTIKCAEINAPALIAAE